MNSLSIICVRCGREMKIKKIGVIAQENIDLAGSPYKLWSCDKRFCPICGYEVLMGFGREPLEHYDTDPEKFKDYKIDVKFF